MLHHKASLNVLNLAFMGISPLESNISVGKRFRFQRNLKILSIVFIEFNIPVVIYLDFVWFFLYLTCFF